MGIAGHDPENNALRRRPGTSGVGRLPRSVYISQAEHRLARTKTKLAGISDRVARIDLARIQVETCLATIEKRLARLRQSDAESSENLRRSINRAWDDLAEALKNIVDRLA